MNGSDGPAWAELSQLMEEDSCATTEIASSGEPSPRLEDEPLSPLREHSCASPWIGQEAQGPRGVGTGPGEWGDSCEDWPEWESQAGGVGVVEVACTSPGFAGQACLSHLARAATGPSQTSAPRTAADPGGGSSQTSAPRTAADPGSDSERRRGEALGMQMSPWLCVPTVLSEPASLEFTTPTRRTDQARFLTTSSQVPVSFFPPPSEPWIPVPLGHVHPVGSTGSDLGGGAREASTPLSFSPVPSEFAPSGVSSRGSVPLGFPVGAAPEELVDLLKEDELVIDITSERSRSRSPPFGLPEPRPSLASRPRLPEPDWLAPDWDDAQTFGTDDGTVPGPRSRLPRPLSPSWPAGERLGPLRNGTEQLHIGEQARGSQGTQLAVPVTRPAFLTHASADRVQLAVASFFGLSVEAVPWRERGQGHWQCRVGREIVNFWPSTSKLHLNGVWGEARRESFGRAMRLEGLSL